LTGEIPAFRRSGTELHPGAFLLLGGAGRVLRRLWNRFEALSVERGQRGKCPAADFM